MTDDRALRLLVMADSDSYVKWGAALASSLPRGWSASIVILATPVQPSPRQLAAALAHTRFTAADVPIIEVDDLEGVLDAARPDAVLLALRGPLVRVITPIVGASPNRPVLVSGFPGLTIPAVFKAVIFREQVDLIVLHSKREVRDFRANAALLQVPVAFGLATLPFLHHARGDGPAVGGDVVFAAQAKVPSLVEDRIRVLGWLAAAARARPDRRVIVKVRALSGEAQTHAEEFDYADLLGRPEVLATLGGVPANLVVEHGPMATHLRGAAGFVTISSTAVLEAVAAGIPALLIDDFGVEPALINTVFEGSGLFGGSADLIAGRMRAADPAWLVDNYFHGEDHDDWLAALERLVAQRAEEPLMLRPRRHNLSGGALRRAFERRKMLGHHDRSLLGRVSMLAGVPARWAVRRVRRVRARFERVA